MNMPENKYPIPQGILDTTIEALRDYAKRLEIESTVYQQMNTSAGRILADDRLQQAAEVKEAFEYFVHL